ncbi:hypothetical protein BXZ70DRAFT_891280 [Cristinia sonorae]|uniref:Uncharacterized protein n=1 Tax=Cristinia sonorae TaxID=1940300 RepID=A0A8K0UPW9_9AGAR|nr:hypothetical protein BXZ70DRAFT_891280 [Cristinia sonorae]
MPLINASTDAFLLSAAAANIPLYLFFRRKPSPAESPNRLAFTVLVLIHTTYILYTLMLHWPPNIFQRLKIPLTLPSDTIRTVLLQKAGLDLDATLPKPLESLLTRMSSFDYRTLYVRHGLPSPLFGQSAMQDCEYCTSYDEFALYALPGPLLEYIRETAFLGLLTITGSHRERWRTYAIAGLVCAAVMEGYTTAVQPIKIPRNGLGVFMLHDNLWLCRQILFLVLPLIIHITRPVPPTVVDPSVTLLQAQNHLQATLTRLTSLKYTRGAIMRDPSLRASATEWWEKQKVHGEVVREDETVQRLAEKMGYGFAGTGEDGKDPKLKANAKLAVNSLTAGLAPPKPVTTAED